MAAWTMDYYVDQTNPRADDQNTGTSHRPWKTITKANHTLVAGDTLYIKAGTYDSYIRPINSGTFRKPITYRNYQKDTVTIANTAYGIHLNSKSYICVYGVNFVECDKFLWLQNNASHNAIAYCNFDQGRHVEWSGSKIYRTSSYNWVHHCRFSKYGYCTDNDIGSILDIGNEESRTDTSSYNLIEDNTMLHGGHHILGIFGRFNVIRNNYFHNENWSNGYGNRNVYLSGFPCSSGRNLIEGNQIAHSGIPPDNWGASGMLLATGYNIVRLNRFYHNNLAGISMSVTKDYLSDIIHNKIYNNSFLHNGFNMNKGPEAMTSAIGMAVRSGRLIIKQNAIKNNLYFLHHQVYGTYNVLISDQIIASNWDGDTQGNPKFVHASDVLGDPQDPSLPDLHLEPDSPCKDSGTYLTTIISSSGSGTSFEVADAGYFADGWGIVPGDTIQLQKSMQRARIIKIDYESNTLKINKTLTWTQNQGISLIYEGSAPDVGAYEIKGPHFQPRT